MALLYRLIHKLILLSNPLNLRVPKLLYIHFLNLHFQAPCRIVSGKSKPKPTILDRELLLATGIVPLMLELLAFLLLLKRIPPLLKTRFNQWQQLPTATMLLYWGR
jgi:hypothetical protein